MKLPYGNDYMSDMLLSLWRSDDILQRKKRHDNLEDWEKVHSLLLEGVHTPRQMQIESTIF